MNRQDLINRLVARKLQNAEANKAKALCACYARPIAEK
jgi:hypothetical protein